MRRYLSLFLAVAVFVSSIVITPTAQAIDLEPGECYQYTRYRAEPCGGQSYVTYEACMDEWGQLHTVIVNVGIWCP